MDVTTMTDEELLAAVRKHQRSRDMIALLAEIERRGLTVSLST